MEGDTAASFAASWTNLPDTVVDEFHHSKELTEQLQKNLKEFFRFSVSLIDEDTTDEFVELFQYPGKMPTPLLQALQELTEKNKVAFETVVRTYREGFYVLISSFEREMYLDDLEDFEEEFNELFSDEEVVENISVDQVQFFAGWGLILLLLSGVLWLVWSLVPKDIPETLGFKAIPESAQMIEIEEKLILPSVFILGCPQGVGVFCDADEESHEVSLTFPISIMQAEVSQALYLEVMEENPSIHLKCGSDCPVENVTWIEAVEFANRLSKNHKLDQCYRISGDKVTWAKGVTCFGWRLPTEAEWEIAAKGGEEHLFAGSSDSSSVAWLLGAVDGEVPNAKKYADISAKPHPSCQKKLNGYGLCDMSGNVWEWTWDWYDHDFYQKQAAKSDPLGGKGNKRVIRGGAWNSASEQGYVYSRMAIQPWSKQEVVSLQGTSKENVDIKRGTVGFRLVRRLPFQNRNREEETKTNK